MRQNQSAISAQSVTAVCLPQLQFSVTFGEYRHGYEAYIAGRSHVTGEDDVRRCVHCGTSTAEKIDTSCANCGSLTCESHTRTERLEGTPGCTGCSVTAEFAFATNHVYDEANLEAFREGYESMPFHEKAMENPPLVGGGAVTAIPVLLTILVVTGLVCPTICRTFIQWEAVAVRVLDLSAQWPSPNRVTRNAIPPRFEVGGTWVRESVLASRLTMLIKLPRTWLG